MQDHNVVAHVGDRYVVVELPGSEVTRVVGLLRGVLDDPRTELATVTGVRHGLGFRVPVKYADDVHEALFGPQRPAPDDDDLAPADNDVADAPDDDPVATDVVEPPRSGRGSGEAAWVKFLQGQGVDSPADATRDELIELWDDRA